MRRGPLWREFVGMACLILFMVIPQVEAHNRSQSYSSWTVSDNTVVLLFSVRSREVTRLSSLADNLLTLEALLTHHLSQTVRVSSERGKDCALQGRPLALAAAAGYLRMQAVFDCGKSPAATLHLDSFFSVAPGHVHYARLLIDGWMPVEYLFTDSRRSHSIEDGNGSRVGLFPGFMQYLVLGVEHILGGVDHLAFLAALLLLVRGFRELAWIVTGFTVGHSVTLSLAVLGHLSLEMWIIEALIGYTVALVAADNIGLNSPHRVLIATIFAGVLLFLGLISVLWGVGLPALTLAGLCLFTVAFMTIPVKQAQARGLRPALTLAFGMVHGFGFANVLGEIGLPNERMAMALAGFNIGVEIGQLAVVAVLCWLVRWVDQSGRDRQFRWWMETASASLCGLGVFWFVTRSFPPL